MKNEIFEALDKARISKGLKVHEVCTLSGLSFQSWISIKNNKGYSIKVLSKICKVLGIDEIKIKVKNYV